MRPPKPTPAELQLKRQNDGKLRRELQTKRTQVGGLKLALHQRLETIDALRGRIEQLREQNRRLDAEAERYAEMVRLSPVCGKISASDSGDADAAPGHCMRHSFLLCISCNGKQFHASQIRRANEIGVETKAC